MENNFDKMMSVIADSEQMIKDDKLAKKLEEMNDELTEEELDLVVAAAKPDFHKFIKKMNEKNK